MDRWKVIAGILLIFVLGAFCGVTGSGLFFKHRVKRFMDPAGPPPPIHFLKQQLDDFQLSAGQQAQIDALLDDMRRDFTELFRKSQPKFNALFDRYISKIREKLRPDQRKKLNRVVKRLGRHMLRMEPSPPGDRDPFSGDRRSGPDPDRQLHRLARELALSREQMQQMRPILEKQREKQHSLFMEDATSEDHSDLREKMMAIGQETDQQLKAIMTPEQVESFKKLHRKRMP
jgi:Spy/CpxP family protein refolding chaperone